MTTRNTRATSGARSRLRAMELELAELKSRISVTDRFGGEEPDVGAILVIDKTFPHTPDRTYTYVALHAENGWYTTSSRTKSVMDFDELIEFIGDCECHIVSDMIRLPKIAEATPVPAAEVDTDELREKITEALTKGRKSRTSSKDLGENLTELIADFLGRR